MDVAGRVAHSFALFADEWVTGLSRMGGPLKPDFGLSGGCSRVATWADWQTTFSLHAMGGLKRFRHHATSCEDNGD